MKKAIVLILLITYSLLSGCVRSMGPGGIPTQPEPTILATSTQINTSTQANLPAPSATTQPTAETGTPVIQDSPTIATVTPTITPTPGPPITFFIQSGTPASMVNFLQHEKGCNWMGIAGQVFGIDGEPLTGLSVHLEGVLDGIPINSSTVTGDIPALGPAGFVFQISDHPIASDGALWLQLLDSSGIPRTGRILLTTHSDCNHNLVLVNFVEGTPLISKLTLPLVLNQHISPP